MMENNGNAVVIPRLVCAHCGSHFVGSDSQARHVKYENRKAYCSDICRRASVRNQLSRPIPNRGPCKTCGKEFFSRTAKIYCSLSCYVRSEQFKEMTRKNREKNLSPECRKKIADTNSTGDVKKCLECDAEFYVKKSKGGRKYCSRVCYRAYLAKRFDRWIANPERMALPQCYDEFLDREELECIVEGCEWKGLHLSLHVNLAHGIRAEEFKRAAGFNLKSGIISRQVSEVMGKRKPMGIALASKEEIGNFGEMARRVRAEQPSHYLSQEGKEHRRKSRALIPPGGPMRICRGCGSDFQQSTVFGRAVYCSHECRDATYRRESQARAKRRVRQPDGTFKWELPTEDGIG